MSSRKECNIYFIMPNVPISFTTSSMCDVKSLWMLPVVTRIIHAKYQCSSINTSEDMSQVKVFVTDRGTDRRMSFNVPRFHERRGTIIYTPIYFKSIKVKRVIIMSLTNCITHWKVIDVSYSSEMPLSRQTWWKKVKHPPPPSPFPLTMEILSFLPRQQIPQKSL